jgi:hypothetical protein
MFGGVIVLAKNASTSYTLAFVESPDRNSQASASSALG